MYEKEVYSGDEQLAVLLTEFKNSTVDITKKQKAESMLLHFVRRHEFTWKQRAFIKQLTKDIAETTRGNKNYFLVAIVTSKDVYIGVTLDPKRTVTRLQKSENDQLKMVWKLSAGPSKRFADKQLKKLRKVCGKSRDTVDWYKLDSLPLVKRFKIRGS